jgi:hypothetical protein
MRGTAKACANFTGNKAKSFAPNILPSKPLANQLLRTNSR